ncbi:MAG: hypothetical protein KF685_01195 [Acidobacteria bacterium]|nr:hypothetical protein [Acidobacteriota bacterium]
MSFDLYFYTRKNQKVASKEIEDYFDRNGCIRDEEFPQWLYESERTGVYFLFEMQTESDDSEDIEVYESFDDFDNTRFTFNINFIRPNFFGLEAFPFVEKLMNEFDLYALDPQCPSDPDNPGRKTAEEYYGEWSKTNINFSSEHFDELELLHFPVEKSNDYWRYNFHVEQLQLGLGDDYFVPSLILVRQASTGMPITISTWTEHIPNVFPPADYFFISRKRKKLFRNVEESGLISRENFMKIFGAYLVVFDFKDCFIIHPDQAESVGELFNKVEFDFLLDGFLGEGIDLSKLTNAERSAEQRSFDE